MGQPAIAMIRALLVLALAPVAHAQPEATEADCGCLWEGSFSQLAPLADLVILGDVTAKKGNAVDINAITSLKGELWLNPVRVWMKTRTYCRPPADDFPEGSRWIMALSQIREVPEDGFNPSTPNQSFGRQYDYVLSSCGGYWLRVNGNTAMGNLVPDMPRFYHHPDMSPVLIELIAGYLNGDVSEHALVEASRQRPEAVDTLILDTRSFLRGQEDWLPDDSASDSDQ